MLSVTLTIILTALLSSFITLGVTLICISKIVVPKLTSHIDESMLPQFQKAVTDGALEAGETLLPEFRANVRDGFQDAMVGAMSGKVAEGAAKSVAQTMEKGISSLLRR